MISVLLTLLLGCTCGGGPPPSAPPSTPNLLVIVWDTVRADRTSLYGYAKPTTPWLESWAGQHGVTYERAVSPAVWTLPSHASLFTGLPGRTHGVNAAHTRLDADLITFAEALHERGYATWAFVANPYMGKDTGLLAGFAVVERPWSQRWLPGVKAHIASKLLPDDASTPLSPLWEGPPATSRYLVKESGPVAAHALDAWLDRRKRGDAPWFAFVNLMEAHLPRIPSAAARQAVMTPEARERAKHLPQTMDAFHDHMAGVQTYGPEDLDAISQLYDATLPDLDTATREILEVLERRGLTEDTVVVITSDHGEQLGERGLLLHKYAIHQELTRVPLVVSWPGHLEPRREHARVSVADALVDVARLAALPLTPELEAQLAARTRPLGEDAAVSEFNAVAPMALDRLVARHPDVDLSRFHVTWQALEEGDAKIVEGSDGSVGLYDLVSDPGEQRDLAADDVARASALQARLEVWRAGTPAHEASTEPEPGVQDRELREGLEALGYAQ